jgi:hypothetical protein
MFGMKLWAIKVLLLKKTMNRIEKKESNDMLYVMAVKMLGLLAGSLQMQVMNHEERCSIQSEFILSNR